MIVEKLERTLSDVASDLAQEPKASEQPGKVKKVAKAEKKAVKKVGKKSNGKAEAAPKKAAKAADSDTVTLADLASEAKITGAAARRKLRGANLSPEGRWKWEDGSKSLKEARKVLGLDA